MPENPAPKPRNTLLYVASVLFVVGVIAIVAIFVVAAVSDGEPGLVFYLIALAAPLGFLLAIVSALRAGRRVP